MDCSTTDVSQGESKKDIIVKEQEANNTETNNGKIVGQDDPDYENWTKKDLIEKIRKLTCHVKQLRNIIRRDGLHQTDDCPGPDNEVRSVKKAKKSRAFDFSKHPKRHVALKVTYLGWDYHGLAVQEDTDNTIEAHLFDALTKAKLVEDRTTSNYHRCGRTDKGVSAFSQIISIDLRSKCNDGKGVIISHCGDEFKKAERISSLDKEIDYCKILNALLPKEIRVIAWAPVKPDFSSRFDCKERVYKYFIPVGEANVNAMQEAGQYLLGTHDFQNFCKADSSVPAMIRRMIAVRISKCESGYGNNSGELTPNKYPDPYAIFEVEIRGQSFLWHQIRCIMAILVLVGEGYEKPEIVKELLDLKKYPQKPQYPMAVDFPLVLFDTHHGEEISEWIYNPENITHVLMDLQSIWAGHAVRASMVQEMIKNLESSMKQVTVNDSGEQVSLAPKPGPGTDVKWVPSAPILPLPLPAQQLQSLIMGTKTKVYKNLIDRPVCGGTGANSTGTGS